MMEARQRLVCMLAAILAVAACGMTPAYGQAGPYENTTVGAINASTTCGSPLVRTINVADSFVIGDLDVGFLATHSWRTDIQLDLTSPQATTVRLINAPANFNRNNYNVRLNDESTTLINTAPHNTNDGTTAPPYENDVMPDNALSAFDGENAQGTWTLTICDTYPAADNGQFVRANLYFTVATDADLSVTKTVDQQFPPLGTNVTFIVTVTNSGPLSASGIQLRDQLPSGLSYVSDNGSGAYNSATGVWSVPGTLNPGNSASLQITASVNASGSYTNLAEVIASSRNDPDSTPDNSASAPLEDDTAVVTLSPGGAPGTPPSLSCSASPNVHDWDSNAWPAGSLAQNYTSGGQPFAFAFTGDTGNFINSSPQTNTNNTGGLTPAQTGLYYIVNHPNTTEAVTLTMNVGIAGVGVSELQFTVFDIDWSNGGFTDEIYVTGYLGGALVAPVLTPGTANTASGFAVTGFASSGSTSAAGNATVTFTQSVDTVVLTYGSGAGAPSNPSQQGMTLHDISFCDPVTGATLTASKTVDVYGPGAFATPGNDMQYTITVQNIGSGPADAGTIELIDDLPSEVTFYNADVDDAGPQTGAVGFTQSAGAGLSWNPSTDIRFSNSTSGPPADFSACTYPGAAGYDANITYVCIRPSGTMQGGAPTKSFSVFFRARIN